MISIEAVVVSVAGLDRGEIERLIAQDFVRPDGEPGAWRFAEIDVARLRLIQELRSDLALEDEALPVVLSLIDQLYATRRHLRRLRATLRDAAVNDAEPI
jgi:chaperone modulatory protein CbpM